MSMIDRNRKSILHIVGAAKHFYKTHRSVIKIEEDRRLLGIFATTENDIIEGIGFTTWKPI